tara:strand:+ start:83 stop:676 length:594 start_codon:yes stop_codon:yes gene_type:complete
MTNYPPTNETAQDRQGKITHLLSIILANCTTLTEWDLNFLEDMKRLLNRYVAIEPATALTEKQARTLRSIIYQKHDNYGHAVPPLPEGVDFKWEVRRLLKSQPNPNEDRNRLIEQAEAVVVDYLRWDGEDGYDGEKSVTGHKYKGTEGDRFVFEISWEGYGDYPNVETWTSTAKVDPTTRQLNNGYRDRVIEPYPIS